jgi:predicted dehydrogenase
MTPLRLIQVGMGGWGRDWARTLARHGELAHVVAYVDLLPDMLRQLRSDMGVGEELCFPSLEAALAATDAEAVLVTTALAGHVPATLAALEAGKHVLVEKPFAPSLEAARQAVDLAEARGLALMVAQNYRFHPAAQTAAALVRDGSLGPVSAVTVQFRKYRNTLPLETNPHYHIRHPLLLDMAIHHFDLMRFVLGQEPQVVSCHAWNPPWSNFADPAAAIANITFGGGAAVAYQGSWVSTAPPTLWAGLWQIECADGLMSWTGRGDKAGEADAVTVRPRGKSPRRLELPDMPYRDRIGALAAFAACLRTGAEPPTSGRDNLASLGLTLAAIEAAAAGQPRSMPAVERTAIAEEG